MPPVTTQGPGNTPPAPPPTQSAEPPPPTTTSPQPQGSTASNGGGSGENSDGVGGGSGERSSDGNDNLVLVVGIIMAAVLVIGVLIVTLVVCVRQKRAKSQPPPLQKLPGVANGSAPAHVYTVPTNERRASAGSGVYEELNESKDVYDEIPGYEQTVARSAAGEQESNSYQPLKPRRHNENGVIASSERDQRNGAIKGEHPYSYSYVDSRNVSTKSKLDDVASPRSQSETNPYLELVPEPPLTTAGASGAAAENIENPEYFGGGAARNSLVVQGVPAAAADDGVIAASEVYIEMCCSSGADAAVEVTQL